MLQCDFYATRDALEWGNVWSFFHLFSFQKVCIKHWMQIHFGNNLTSLAGNENIFFSKTKQVSPQKLLQTQKKVVSDANLVLSVLARHATSRPLGEGSEPFFGREAADRERRSRERSGAPYEIRRRTFLKVFVLAAYPGFKNLSNSQKPCIKQ